MCRARARVREALTHAVHRHAASGDWVLRRVHELVALAQVVPVGALVQHVRDHAVELGAESVVRLLVRVAARGEDRHAQGGAVRRARDIV